MPGENFRGEAELTNTQAGGLMEHKEFIHSTRTGSYSARSFEAWPSNTKLGKWFVRSIFYGDSWAVIDDFGNLVRVPA